MKRKVEGMTSLFDLFEAFELSKESGKKKEETSYHATDYLKREVVITDLSRTVKPKERNPKKDFVQELASVKGLMKIADTIALNISAYYTYGKITSDFATRAARAVYNRYFADGQEPLIEALGKSEWREGEVDQELNAAFEEYFRIELPTGVYFRTLEPNESEAKELIGSCLQEGGNKGALSVAVLSNGNQNWYLPVGCLLQTKYRGGRWGYRSRKKFYNLEDTISVIERLVLPEWVHGLTKERAVNVGETDVMFQRAMQFAAERFKSSSDGKSKKYIFFEEQKEEYEFLRAHLGEALNAQYIPCSRKEHDLVDTLEIALFLQKPLLSYYGPEPHQLLRWLDGPKHWCYLLSILMREQRASYESEKYDKDLREASAHVFQTKKNIPQVMLDAMSKSSLNKVFGFVEFDESTDLEKIEEMEKCFHAVNDTYFFGSVHSDWECRLRKCGKYHASGLCFPHLKCICVDPRNTTSFMHEYFHLIDHEKGELSRQVGFFDIATEFEILFRKAVNTAKGPETAILNGNSKYNIDYYLVPTEIFARCGEVYLEQNGVNNSVQTVQGGLPYRVIRENPELLEKVVNYFDRLALSYFDAQSELERRKRA